MKGEKDPNSSRYIQFFYPDVFLFHSFYLFVSFIIYALLVSIELHTLTNYFNPFLSDLKSTTPSILFNYYLSVYVYNYFSLFLSLLKCTTNPSFLLSKSESVKFSPIESVICLFTESSVAIIFSTVKSAIFH